MSRSGARRTDASSARKTRRWVRIGAIRASVTRSERRLLHLRDALGSSAGPVGTLLGGVAGAIGGWWTGRAIAEAAEKLSAEDDQDFRAHYESSTERISDQSYDDIRGAYFLGHIASNNPNFVDREFTEIEPELARGWRDCTARPCDWEQARAFVGEGYRRGAQRRQRTDRRTVERVEELERRLDERRTEEHGEVL